MIPSLVEDTSMNQPLSSELRSFHAFLTDKLNNGSADLLPEEVLEQWRELHPEPFDDEDDVAAIQAALDDVARGDKGMPFDEFDREFRKQHKIPGPPRPDICTSSSGPAAI
jgi:hypothetical protein